MTDATLDSLPAPLRTALERRGYDALTAVQTAVLEEANRGRDLKISSQTGSGKTVAVGFAVSEALAEAAPDGGGPVVLVIVPTRELAAQVGDELSWLFAEFEGSTLDVVTGGTSVRGERERLVRPPRVLVGTPGRLLDHLQAGAIDLSSVRELVLDEADQMLDLGFRDELEGLLDSTPAERRTHLVSATFPDGVRRLAERYQRDALHVEGTALGEANADIEHVAVRVHANDRYAALVNLLLLDPTERTLIFVATRAGAAQLADRLAEDGFAALPLSGDLAQAQRTRTLAAFKAGVVQILVATDVAARGLDLPEVGCVVHTSPAMDGEAFTHRSGRTGRAGRSGRSLLLVTPRQERKIRFQLSDAGVDADWRPAPTADQVRAAREERERTALIASVEGELADERLEQARALLEGREAERVVAALLDRAAAHSGPRPVELGAPSAARGDRDRFDAPSRERDPARHAEPSDGVRFQINWGFHGGANPKRILAHVCRRGGVQGRDVGAIRLFPRSSTFEIAPDQADAFEERVAPPDDRDPHLKIRRWLADGPPVQERHDRGPRPPHGDDRRAGPPERGGRFGDDRRRPYDGRPHDRRPHELRSQGGAGERDDRRGFDRGRDDRRGGPRGPYGDDRGDGRGSAHRPFRPGDHGGRGPDRGGRFGDGHGGPRGGRYGDDRRGRYGDDRRGRHDDDRGGRSRDERGPRGGDRGPRPWQEQGRGPRPFDPRERDRDRGERPDDRSRSAFERRQGGGRRPFLDQRGGDRARRFGGGRGDRG